MDLFKSIRRRSVLSEVAYVFLNILLAVMLLVLVIVVNVPWPALGLVLLSKWRIFAVRSRYWVANIRANLIDTIVGVSMVVLLHAASGDLTTQISLTALFVAWLLFLKPRSKRAYVAAQAMTGLVFGIAAIIQISPSLPVSVVVALSWVVGYAATRHILSIQHESHINFLSLLWGFVVAEIMWLSYHWTIGYQIGNSLQLSQVVVIIAALSFLAERIYVSYHKNGQVRANEVLMPVLFSISVIMVLVVDMLRRISDSAI
ncbi:hypothetical protein H7142_00460 [Candidatus Saccharibacteria bacterium]|nr:hypothetical protein [Candidatus Saccharibacteria bacterium]